MMGEVVLAKAPEYRGFFFIDSCFDCVDDVNPAFSQDA
jgi:hypothetical protein